MVEVRLRNKTENHSTAHKMMRNLEEIFVIIKQFLFLSRMYDVTRVYQKLRLSNSKTKTKNGKILLKITLTR